jgi:hypothetical protein
VLGVAPPTRFRRQREAVLAALRDDLRPGEQVVAVLPFASTPKRPKGPEGKVRQGVYQRARHFRPLVATSSRLIVVDAYRSPSPRGLLADYPIDRVREVDLVPARMGQQMLHLDLPGEGEVPFLLGRFDLIELDQFRDAIGG